MAEMMLEERLKRERRELRKSVNKLHTLAAALLDVLEHPREPLPDDNHLTAADMLLAHAAMVLRLAVRVEAYSYPPPKGESGHG